MSLLADKTFNAIWEFWLNKEGERAAEKAITIAIDKQGDDPKKIIKACEAYRLENIGKDVEYTYKLSNFILQDHWKDVLESTSVEKLQKLYDESIAIINCWNQFCRSHWCRVVDAETKAPIVMRALRDKCFADNWHRALIKASSIFKYPFRDGDPRQKIILSLRWFTNVSCDKHTVLKIIEGEYGQEEKEQTRVEQKTIPVDYEARKKAAEEFADLVKSAGFDKPKQPKQSKQNGPSKQAKEIADKILKSIGAEKFVDSEGDGEFTLL